jgi:hypothetical protein
MDWSKHPRSLPSIPSLLNLSLQHSNTPHLHTGPEGILVMPLHLTRLELQDYTISALTFSAALPPLTSLVIQGD